MTRISTAIRGIRSAQNLSMAETSRRTGIPYQRYQNIENGYGRAVTRKELDKIGEVLNVKFEWKE